MSIAGIAKEVTQILVSTWLFGDERLTPLNLIGVGVTVCGARAAPKLSWISSSNISFIIFRYQLIYLPQVSQIRGYG